MITPCQKQCVWCFEFEEKIVTSRSEERQSHSHQTNIDGADLGPTGRNVKIFIGLRALTGGRNVKSPTREEVRRALNTDQQLGGGVLLVQIGRHWEEECAASMF